MYKVGGLVLEGSMGIKRLNRVAKSKKVILNHVIAKARGQSETKLTNLSNRAIYKAGEGEHRKFFKKDKYGVLEGSANLKRLLRKRSSDIPLLAYKEKESKLRRSLFNKEVKSSPVGRGRDVHIALNRMSNRTNSNMQSKAWRRKYIGQPEYKHNEDKRFRNLHMQNLKNNLRTNKIALKSSKFKVNEGSSGLKRLNRKLNSSKNWGPGNYFNKKTINTRLSFLDKLELKRSDSDVRRKNLNKSIKNQEYSRQDQLDTRRRNRRFGQEIQKKNRKDIGVPETQHKVPPAYRTSKNELLQNLRKFRHATVNSKFKVTEGSAGTQRMFRVLKAQFKKDQSKPPAAYGKGMMVKIIHDIRKEDHIKDPHSDRQFNHRGVDNARKAFKKLNVGKLNAFKRKNLVNPENN